MRGGTFLCYFVNSTLQNRVFLHKNTKKCKFFENFCKNIWWFRKNVVILYPKSKTNEY